MKQMHIFAANERLVEALLANAVRFIVVGGLGVHFYVPTRAAQDLDLLIEQTPNNATQLFSALTAENIKPGFPVELISAPTERPQQIPLKVLHFADLLTPGNAIDFSAEWDRSTEALIGKCRVRIAARELLIRMKRGTGRERDNQDVELLEAAG